MAFSAGQKLTASNLNASLGVQTVGGQLRVTQSANTSSTTEMAWATTPALNLAANTTFSVEAELFMVNSAGAADVYIARIRDTNVSGTIRQAIDTPTLITTGAGPFSFYYSYTFTTTTAVSGYIACATLVRFSGSDSAAAAAGSSLIVKAIGSNTVLSTA